jgi:hypothetical protein
MSRIANAIPVFRAVGLAMAIALLSAASLSAEAEVLASWNPAGTIDSTFPLAASSISPNVTSAGNLTGGPGLTPPGLFANAYVFDNWSAGAFDANDYLAFSVTGSGVSYQTVAFSLYNNFDGSGNWEIRSSVDGFSATLDSGSFTGIFAGGLLINANVSALGQQSGTVTFHIYTFNNAGTTNPLQRGVRGTGGGGQGLAVIGFVAPPGPPVLASALSRKVHGVAGTFNLPLSLADIHNPTTEPRQGPTHTIVVTFNKAINAATATITEGTATAGAPTFSGNDVIVGLVGVTDRQYVTIALTNVASTDGSTGGNGSVRVGFLVGDVSQNRVVTLTDLGLVNAQLAQTVTAANFLKDVNVSGTVSLADKAVTNANLTRALPTP